MAPARVVGPWTMRVVARVAWWRRGRRSPRPSRRCGTAVVVAPTGEHGLRTAQPACSPRPSVWRSSGRGGRNLTHKRGILATARSLDGAGLSGSAFALFQQDRAPGQPLRHVRDGCSLRRSSRCVLLVALPGCASRFSSLVGLLQVLQFCGQKRKCRHASTAQAAKKARRWQPNACTQREAERGERRGRARGHGGWRQQRGQHGGRRRHFSRFTLPYLTLPYLTLPCALLRSYYTISAQPAIVLHLAWHCIPLLARA